MSFLFRTTPLRRPPPPRAGRGGLCRARFGGRPMPCGRRLPGRRAASGGHKQTEKAYITKRGFKRSKHKKVPVALFCRGLRACAAIPARATTPSPPRAPVLSRPPRGCRECSWVSLCGWSRAPGVGERCEKVAQSWEDRGLNVVNIYSSLSSKTVGGDITLIQAGR